MGNELWILLAAIGAGFAGLYWLLLQKQSGTSTDREVIKNDLDNKQKAIEKLVADLQHDLESRQREIRDLELDRTKKFSELTTALQQHREQTTELAASTDQLNKVLSNNQQRGEWGERIIEDLMISNGLVEGIHYQRQTKLADSTLRPDVTLLLPDKRVVPVDVKFPYAEIQKLAQADNKAQQAAHIKQFGQDLKVKIAKVAEYINPSQNTLDYAIMFVPNEMVFSFLNQRFPDLIDEAISKRVLIVSPFTFLVVARTVLESYRNFMIGDKLREVVKSVDEFMDEWEKLKGKFEKYGRSLATLQTDYQELTSTRFRQMDKKIDKIQGYRQGNLLK